MIPPSDGRPVFDEINIAMAMYLAWKAELAADAALEAASKAANPQKEDQMAPELEAKIETANERLRAFFPLVVPPPSGGLPYIEAGGKQHVFVTYANGRVKMEGEASTPISSVFEAIDKTIEAIIVANREADVLCIRSGLTVTSWPHDGDKPGGTTVRMRCVGLKMSELTK